MVWGSPGPVPVTHDRAPPSLMEPSQGRFESACRRVVAGDPHTTSPGPPPAAAQRQSWDDAIRAPSDSARNFAQAISGSTCRIERANVAKPQSVPAMTRSRPTTSA